MSVEIAEFLDVRARAADLGLRLTSQLALLPRGFAEAESLKEIAHESEATTVRKLLVAAGLEVEQLEPASARFPAMVEHQAAWIAPTIFIGSLLLTQNPYAVQVALSVLASYVAEFLRGRGLSNIVKFKFVVEHTAQGKFSCVTYEGPAAGLKDLETVIREAQRD